jgi:hypothetical protein
MTEARHSSGSANVGRRNCAVFRHGFLKPSQSFDLLVKTIGTRTTYTTVRMDEHVVKRVNLQHTEPCLSHHIYTPLTFPYAGYLVLQSIQLACMSGLNEAHRTSGIGTTSPIDDTNKCAELVTPNISRCANSGVTRTLQVQSDQRSQM